MKRWFVVTALSLMSSTLFAERLQFAVIGVDCSACAAPIKKALSGVAGVTNIKVDTKAKSATVDVPEGFDREKLRTALTNAGFDAQFSGETRTELQPLSDEAIASLDIVVRKDGAKVDLSQLMQKGKITIVDWYGDWCGPCHVLENRLEHLMQANHDIALRRINIGKWDNAAAKQATDEFRLEALPYIRLYDANGKFVTAVSGGMWDEVLAAIEKARAKK